MVYNNNKINNVETNLQNGTTLKIAMNAKTFRMLSDTLYSDKIKAIIRELSCNAYDAHIMANTLETKEIEVNLPTILNPIFMIRDYGVGMSHNMLLANYLTYGESTKDDSNNQIGCFGIGSKSPFAYTDSFIVISYYEGVKNTYSIYLDNGIPQCVLIDTEDTNEHNGLLIQFNVEQEDVKKFEEAAKKVFKYFDILPKFNYDIKILKDKFDVEKEKYSLKYGYSSTPKIEAIQGNISYPVDNSLLDKINFKADHIVLKCNIGDFGFAPSREAISYDIETINKLNLLLKEIDDEYFNNIVEELKSSTNIGEYSKKVYKHSRYVDFKDYLITKFNIESFNGIKIDYSRYSHLDCNIENVSFKNISKSIRGKGLTIKRNNRYDTLKDYFLYQNYKFIYNDLDKKGNPNLIVNYYNMGKTIKDAFLLINCYEKELKVLEELYGKIDKLSDFIEYDEEKMKLEQKLLNEAKKLERESKKITNQDLFVLKNMSYWSSNYKFISKEIDDIKDLKNCYYIILKRKNNKEICIDIFGKEYVLEEYKEIFKLIDKHNVVFIRQNKVNSLKEQMKIKAFDEFIKKNINKNINLYLKLIKYNKDISFLNGSLKKFLINNKNDFKNLDKTIQYNINLIKLYSRFYVKNKIHHIEELMNSNIMKFINECLNVDTNKNINEEMILLNKYPMLKFLNDRNYLDEEFKNYILEKSQIK